MAPVLLDGPLLGGGGVHQLVVSYSLVIVNHLRLLSPYLIPCAVLGLV